MQKLIYPMRHFGMGFFVENLGTRFGIRFCKSVIHFGIAILVGTV